MEQELYNFETILLNEVNELSSETGKNKRLCFTEIALQKLENYGIISDPNLFSFSCFGRNNKKISLDGYCFDDTDSSLILFITDYTENFDEMILNNDIIQRAYTTLWNVC